MELRAQPLTTGLWPAIEDLFESGTACKRCWCMYWRIGAAYHKRPPAANKEAFHVIVEQGPPPGLLAFDGASAVGWCQLSPRDSLPYLDRIRTAQTGGHSASLVYLVLFCAQGLP